MDLEEKISENEQKKENASMKRAIGLKIASVTSIGLLNVCLAINYFVVDPLVKKYEDKNNVVIELAEKVQCYDGSKGYSKEDLWHLSELTNNQIYIDIGLWERSSPYSINRTKMNSKKFKENKNQVKDLFFLEEEITKNNLQWKLFYGENMADLKKLQDVYADCRCN